ncbi:MAG: hypothetical protein E7485_04355 [Ruminococcaceae bacterium]|nr:hypothetical protein [Oscillospiraceae bacterium]
MDENKKLPEEIEEDTAEVIPKSDGTVTEYEGMSKKKEAFLKALPLLITLVCVGIFALGIKWVAGMFYTPVDTLYEKNGFKIVHCYQNPSNTYYVYNESFEFVESEYENVANEHENAHFAHAPLVYFILNESELPLDKTVVKMLYEGNGVYVMQFGEFVLYRLEGQYGVFAPLRNYEESATSRKNDLYVIRQLLKEDRYKQYELPEGTSEAQFLEMLEKIEWYLDTEYEEDL